MFGIAARNRGKLQLDRVSERHVAVVLLDTTATKVRSRPEDWNEPMMLLLPMSKPKSFHRLPPSMHSRTEGPV